jgi:hypothetical protein
MLNLPNTKNIYIIRQETLVGMHLNRNEAINFLKELLRNSTNISPEAISFEQLPGYRGLTVRIKGDFCETYKETVRNTAKKNCLAIREEKNQILIFKPK